MDCFHNKPKAIVFLAITSLLLMTLEKSCVCSFHIMQVKHSYLSTSIKASFTNNRNSAFSFRATAKTGENEEEIFQNIPCLSRRELINGGSALSIALGFLENPSEASAIASEAQKNSNSISPNSNSKASIPNEIPFSSVRKQKLITLPNNGLKVLIVTDKRASQSTAALIVNGPGQFKDPPSLPGLAHLMEHMVLSYRNSVQEDFEDWLSDKGGASNAFTAYSETCFHFICPHDVLGRALERFASLFMECNVRDTCRNNQTLAREIRRVDSELDFNNVYCQEDYVRKLFVNPEHPYSKFSQGSLSSLETIPKEKNINVGEKLYDFFHNYYLPSQAALVVVSNQQDPLSLERWITPFGLTMSTKPKLTRPKSRRPAINNSNDNLFADGGVLGTYHYPGQFLQGKRYKHVVLYRSKDDSASSSLSQSNAYNEKLILQWVLNEDYRGSKKINVVETAFVLDQILGRRGQGSLFKFLRKRGWIQNTSTLPLHFSVPVNVSGFQVLKLELTLTLKGFLERSRVVAAIYESIESLRSDQNSFVISREIMAEYATIAKLFGYILPPRPSDAVELASDSMNYGIDTVESGKWYRFPSTEDNLGGLGINRIRRAVSATLFTLSDPEKALIIVTAGDKAISMADSRFLKDPIPPISSSKWKKESISGARIFLEDMLLFRSKAEEAVLLKLISKEELLPPLFNPLVPTFIRPSRKLSSSTSFNQPYVHKKYLSLDENKEDKRWILLDHSQKVFPLPRGPPEANCQCAYVMQLLSSRPSTASADEAANAELWKATFEMAATDLAELGAPGNLAYELRFNKYGLRISFLGISQTLPSYARRLMQLLVKHQSLLVKEKKSISQSVKDTAILNAKRAPGLSPTRRRLIINTLQKATSADIAQEGNLFLKSCTGAVCFSEGDLLIGESIQLMHDLHRVLLSSMGMSESGNNEDLNIPPLSELTSPPGWKPRNASPCYVAGVSLMSDACGRIPR